MINEEGSTKIVSFMIPRAGIIVLGRGQISQKVKIICSLIHPRGKGSCAVAWSCSEHALFLLLFLSSLGHGSDKLSLNQ